MKKKLVCLLLAVTAAALMMTACNGTTPTEGDVSEPIALDDVFNENDDMGEVTVPEDEPFSEEIPKGMYRSELTGELISEDLKNQRPIAVMVDNESIALDHFGVNSGDIVYEMMNSTMNGRITRLMVVIKDWEKIEKLGSIRSTRPTNIIIAAEYNAILVHDGGPFYINDWLAKGYTPNLSGGFARYSNGKSSEFTEYVTYDSYKNPNTGKSYPGLGDRIDSAKYSREYTDLYQGDHFRFDVGGVDLSATAKSKKAENIELPFPHNSSKLKYNKETKMYEYYEYGKAHIDPLDDNKTTSFKNVILQDCYFAKLDDHGYLIYDAISKGEGYYITEGYAVPVKWEKKRMEEITTFTNAETGKEIELNVGKTYIGIVPYDSWDELVLE